MSAECCDQASATRPALTVPALVEHQATIHLGECAEQPAAGLGRHDPQAGLRIVPRQLAQQRSGEDRIAQESGLDHEDALGCAWIPSLRHSDP